MSKRDKKLITFSKQNLDYIEEIKEKYDLKYFSDALNKIIKEHMKIEKSSDALSKKIDEINLNSQIALDLLNGIYIKDGLGDILPPEDFKSDALRSMERYRGKKR